jgi:formate dehydrogenase maturation protein FdhE
MGDIKSALEIAMEKVEKLGKATDEERLKWKYLPEGEKLAARYLKQGCNLVVELSQYQENVRKYIIEGAEDILIRDINLPRDDLAKRKNKQAMDGLKTLKSDKVSVENVYSKLRRIFEHYREQGEQQRKQAYESLKTEFEARIQEAIQQQLGSFAGIRVDVERQPQFQEEWHRIQAQLNSQYVMLLDEYKRELRAIA